MAIRTNGTKSQVGQMRDSHGRLLSFGQTSGPGADLSGSVILATPLQQQLIPTNVPINHKELHRPLEEDETSEH